MLTRTEPSKHLQMPLTHPERLVLNQSALDAARQEPAPGALTPHSGH